MKMNPAPHKALPAGVVPIAALDLVSVTVEKLIRLRRAGRMKPAQTAPVPMAASISP